MRVGRIILASAALAGLAGSGYAQQATVLCGGTALQADAAVKEHQGDQADACQQAKDQFLAASDEEALAVAEKKVKILCH